MIHVNRRHHPLGALPNVSAPVRPSPWSHVLRIVAEWRDAWNAAIVRDCSDHPLSCPCEMCRSESLPPEVEPDSRKDDFDGLPPWSLNTGMYGFGIDVLQPPKNERRPR